MNSTINIINYQYMNNNDIQAQNFSPLTTDTASNQKLCNASNNNDSIEITEKNVNIINTKKASDAFKDSCSEKDNSCMYIIVKAMMKDDGINVPDFTSNNSTDFIPFIDKMKYYAKNLIDGNDDTFYHSGTSPLTNDFLDFCDSYKEKLIQYGCK